MPRASEKGRVSGTVPERRPTTAKLLAAAIDVFSKKGLAATTREIAEAAGVNEATLFRQFESKDHLIEAVTREIVAEQAEALQRVDLEDFNPRRDLTRLAIAYERAMTRHQAYIRTMLSQPADRRLAEKIVREVVEPLRAKFISYLAEGQRRKVVRKMNLSASVDAFTAMIFAYVLRSAFYRAGYSRKAYLTACVDIFLEGICRSSASMRECK
ncbi:MAG TPA: TetR/AcrR family transcriptional regulator [Bryobacteraceae bacterium]|nr:TetR/AcrR family transcriptional regulator [Bryobacteraceae bacterium]